MGEDRFAASGPKRLWSIRFATGSGVAGTLWIPLALMAIRWCRMEQNSADDIILRTILFGRYRRACLILVAS